MSLPHSDSPPSLDVVSPYIPGWKGSAVIGTIAGMLAVPAVEAVTKTDFEILVNSHKLVNICNKREQSQLARLTRSFRVGGVRGGVFAVTLMGVLNYLNEKRGVVDLDNFAASTAVAGGAFGLMSPAFPCCVRHRRVLTAMALSVSAGVISYPLWTAYLKAVEKLRVYTDDDLLKQSKEGGSDVSNFTLWFLFKW